MLKAFFLPVCAISIFSCTNHPSKPAETIAKKADTLHIYTDSSLRVILNEQRKAFENQHINPVISITYMDEAGIIKGLLDNTINCAVLHRNLSQSESGHILSRESFTPKQYVFAYDAFVCVTSMQNPDTAIQLSTLEDFLKGQKNSNFQLSVEGSKSQSVQFLKTRFNLSGGQVSRIYAENGLDELLDHLRGNPGAFGMIPFSYISDIEAQSTVELLKGLKVMPIIHRDSAQRTITVQPSQETISTREYPLVSPIVLVNANMDKKSGTNFVNYIFKPSAQRLILRCGLCPAIFPGREINIKTN